MKKILIVGKNSQLAKVLQKEVKNSQQNIYIFTDKSEVDITNKQQIYHFVAENKIDIVINCSAYTAVDKAEDFFDKVMEINYIGVKNLISVCEEFKIGCIHFSTDYVYDGQKNESYIETDVPNPMSVYGKSKLLADIELQKSNLSYLILRTSWLYSEFEDNFVTKILKLAKNQSEISVVSDQIGTPTSATDLAKFVILAVENQWYINRGVYHFSNKGRCSWFEFAQKIVEFSQKKCKVIPCKTEDFITKANRPKFSVLSKEKLEKTFSYVIPFWEDSLKKTINKLTV